MKSYIFTIDLPFTGTVKYSYLTVGDKRKFDIAMQVSNSYTVVTNIVFDNAVDVKNNKLNVESMPYFEVILLYISILAKSTSDVFRLKYICSKCKSDVFTEKNLEDIYITNASSIVRKPIAITNKTNNVTVKITYPTYKNYVEGINAGTVGISNLVTSCIKEIHYVDTDCNAISITEPSVEDINNLPLLTFNSIAEYMLNTLPDIAMDVSCSCESCGNKINDKIIGYDFFLKL